MHDAALALETLLVQRREAAAMLLNVDMFDRWGPKDGPEFDQMMAAGAEAQRRHTEVTRALDELARATWEREPQAIVAWAEAHVDLLERFVAEHPDDAHDTARFVATKELDEWREVARGQRPWVDENCYYVHVDPARHAELFGQPSTR